MLESVDQVTDLGVILDNGLTFAVHAAHIIKRANTTAYLLNRTFGSLDQSLFKLLFVAFVRPILEYASVIWSPPFKKDVLLIERVECNSCLWGYPYKIYHEKYNSRVRKSFLTNRIFNVWNGLSDDVVNSSTAVFRQRMLHYFENLFSEYTSA